MNEELVLNAMKLFDTPDKWHSFIELVSITDTMQNKWWKKLQTEVNQRELNNSDKEWSILTWSDSDIRWYLREGGQKSLAVHFWRDSLRVFSNYGTLDFNKVNQLIKDPKFDIIKRVFDRLDGSNDQTIGWETKNFYFNSEFDGRFPDARTLAWYAGNRTSDFADQLINKVRKFQTPEITALFREINQTCKK